MVSCTSLTIGTVLPELLTQKMTVITANIVATIIITERTVVAAAIVVFALLR